MSGLRARIFVFFLASSGVACGAADGDRNATQSSQAFEETSPGPGAWRALLPSGDFDVTRSVSFDVIATTAGYSSGNFSSEWVPMTATLRLHGNAATDVLVDVTVPYVATVGWPAANGTYTCTMSDDANDGLTARCDVTGRASIEMQIDAHQSASICIDRLAVPASPTSLSLAFAACTRL